jgi:hypothetical protein
MALVIGIVAGSVLLLAVGVWAWVTREGQGTERDLGSISGQWINERRAQERQPDNR